MQKKEKEEDLLTIQINNKLEADEASPKPRMTQGSMLASAVKRVELKKDTTLKSPKNG